MESRLVIYSFPTNFNTIIKTNKHTITETRLQDLNRSSCFHFLFIIDLCLVSFVFLPSLCLSFLLLFLILYLFYTQCYHCFLLFCMSYSSFRGRRLIGISGSLICSETLMELVFNPCGEFRWSAEGPVSQIHPPHLLTGAPGIFSYLLRSFQVLKREWGAENKMKTMVKLQPWFLNFQ